MKEDSIERRKDKKKKEGRMQPFLQLGNKLLQPQPQPQLQQLAWSVHCYLGQTYNGKLAHTCEGAAGLKTAKETRGIT